jgi:putative ABC transport system substrate-binding protein
MERRAFIHSLVVGILAAPHGARAQSTRKVYRIGILNSSVYADSDLAGPAPKSPYAGALLRGLRELGYVYGEHFVTEPRSAEGKLDRLPKLAAELIRLDVDVIVGSGPVLVWLKDATATVPVVMVGAADPVRQGFAQSLGRPGGNFTGLSIQMVETTGKRLELLKELVPGRAPVGVLWDARSGPVPLSWQAAEAAARARRWPLLSLEIRDAGEIEGAFKAATGARAGALLVLPSSLLDQHAPRIVELAAKSRLPAMYGFRHDVDNGGLVSYSADAIEMFRRAAVFVDKILKGARPADLAIEQPTKFELVINLKAARSIGLKC